MTLVHIHRLFNRRALMLDGDCSSPFWKMLEFIGIPKSKDPRSFTDIRWICKSAVLQKWYIRSLMPAVHLQLMPSHVQSYGFKRGCNTMCITGIIREILYFADVWGLPLIVASQDIQTAFDDMEHNMVCQSLCARGISSQTSALLS